MQPPLKTLHAMCVRIDRCTTCVGDLELDGPRCAAVITTRKNVLVASVCLVVLCWEPESAFALLGLRLLSQEMKQEMMQYSASCVHSIHMQNRRLVFFSPKLFHDLQ